MKTIIDRVKKILKKHNNVSMYCGILNEQEIKKLSKYFKVEKGWGGYYRFENK